MAPEPVNSSADPAKDAWARSRFHRMALEMRKRSPCVTAVGPGGERVNISSAEEVFALMALANAALPTGDERRITRPMVLALRTEVHALDREIQALEKAARRLAERLPAEGEAMAGHAQALVPRLDALRRVAAVLEALLAHKPRSHPTQRSEAPKTNGADPDHPRRL